MSAKNKAILIAFSGDVVVDRDNPCEVFADVRELLREPDILFGNLESPYSDTPEIAITAPLMLAPRAHNLDAYVDAGFSVMSMANNHIGDAGHSAMLETRSRLKSQGIATCGAGENLTEARRPAIVERRGLKVGFLAYASIFPHGYEARASVPGLAPLRAYNHFHEMPEYFSPGYLPRVETIPDPTDHRNLAQDIEALRKKVDFVVMSFHWGDHLRAFVLTDHERRTARLCIDRGADLVIGHHHHALRGVEWYQNKPIFYGLGHFVFDLRLVVTEELKTYIEETDPQGYGYAVAPREGWPLLPLHPDTRMTMLAWVRVEGGSIRDVGFVPCRLRPDGRVVAVDPDSTEGREVIDYVNRCNESQKLNGKILREGAPIVGGHQSVRVVPID
jgi:poly-gamma-glutamate capsule biosynthesis protein CapA/YwtB (metallophosphatase superfamily)